MKQFYSSDENIFYTFKCISEECSKLFCIVQIITGIIYFATLQKLFCFRRIVTVSNIGSFYGAVKLIAKKL